MTEEKISVWNFRLDNTGKVASADISMSPLVLLVGQNNTGKSYVATVAWAISRLQPLLTGPDARSRRPAWFTDFAKTDRIWLEIDDALAAEVIDHVNTEFARNGASFLGDVFAFDGFQNAQVAVQKLGDFQPFDISLAQPPEEVEENRLVGPFTTMRLREIGEKRIVPIRIPFRDRARVADRAYYEIVTRVLFGLNYRQYRAALYIPAARTGLMLALSSLTSSLFAEDDTASLVLPKPVLLFLQAISSRRFTTRREENPVAEWLQKEIMRGRIDVTEDPVPAYTYVPEDTELAVPLHATSSMITELAPFLVMLRNGGGRGLIIFEEPEAHLHLSAQRNMARVLARLLNSGVRMMVTTHSDTFVQQINNLMHLHQHPDRDQLMKELNYELEDLIDPAIAKAYEFQPDGNSTVVVELQKQVEGFVVPSLNETLIKLAEETISLDRDE